MSRTLPERVLPLVLAAAFLAAGGGSPYGLHDCPHHDPVPAEAHDHGSDVDDPGDRAGADASAGTDGHHPGGPCTCIGDCHASATTPVPIAGPEAAADVAAGASRSGSIHDRGRLTGHRHRRFELHLPNAPPAPPRGSTPTANTIG